MHAALLAQFLVVAHHLELVVPIVVDDAQEVGRNLESDEISERVFVRPRIAQYRLLEGLDPLKLLLLVFNSLLLPLNPQLRAPSRSGLATESHD